MSIIFRSYLKKKFLLKWKNEIRLNRLNFTYYLLRKKKKRNIRRGREIYNKNQMNLTLYTYKSFWNHSEDNMRYFNFPKRQWFAHFMEHEIKFFNLVTWLVSGKCEKLNHIRCEWIEWNKNFKWNQLSNEVYRSMLPYLNQNHYSRIEWMILRFSRELGLLITFRKCFCPSLACVCRIVDQVSSI